MRLDIRGQGFDLTNAVKDYTERRLAIGPGRGFHHVSRAVSKSKRQSKTAANGRSS
jgi:hypothetical protein